MKHLKSLLFSAIIFLSLLFSYSVHAQMAETDNGLVISGIQSLKNVNITNDIYVTKDALFTIEGNVTITGNVYNWGSIKADEDSSLTINGTFNTLSYTLFHPTIITKNVDGYDYGSFQSSGTVSIQTLNVSDNYIDTPIPEIKEPTPEPEPDENKISCRYAYVAKNGETITDCDLGKTLYVPKDVTVTISGNNLFSDVYVYGTINSSGTITVTGTLNCLHYGSSFSAGDYTYGYFKHVGKSNISDLNVSDSYLAKTIPEIEHTPIEKTIKNATCSSTGLKESRCLFCNELIDTITIEKIDHPSYTDTIITPATCSHTGLSERRCSVCNELIDTITIEKIDHPSFKYIVLKKASCTNTGLAEKRCSACDELFETEVLPKAGHMYDSWSETKAPTALENGIESRKCLVCGDIQTRETSKIKATVHLNKDTISVKQGSSSTDLKITSWSDGDSVSTWASSDTSIATVTSDGKITAIKAGTATITVTMKSGCSASCNVTVEQSNTTVKPSKVKLNKTKLTIKKGKKYTLKLKGTTKKVKWKTSNKKIATVNKNGKVTAKKKGKAIITAKVGKKTYKCRITVK